MPYDPRTPYSGPSRIPDNAFDRLNIAWSNIARMDPWAAARALVTPLSLSPKEARSLADDLGVGGGSKLRDFVVRVITDPVVLFGLVTSIAFPIPSAANMFKFAGWIGNRMGHRLGPLMRWVGAVDDIFPRDMADLVWKVQNEHESFRREFGDKVQSAITKAVGGGLKWDEHTKVWLAARLDGLDKRGIIRPTKGTTAFESLVTDMRGIHDDIWARLYADQAQRALLSQKALIKYYGRDVAEGLARKFGGLSGLTGEARTAAIRELRGTMGSLRKSLRGKFFGDMEKITDYWSHQVPLDERDYTKIIQSMISTAGTRQRFAALSERAATIEGPVSALPRRGRMVPSLKDLDKIKDLVDPAAREKIAGALAGKTNLRTYSLDFERVMASHIHGSAKAYSWNIPVEGEPLGERLVRLNQKLREGGDGVRANIMDDTYIPLALGRKQFGAAMASANFNDYKLSISDAITKGKASKYIPREVRDWAGKILQRDTGILSLQNLGSRLAGLTYTGALGANPISAAYNLMQSLLTTMPTIGPVYTARGFQSVLQKAPAYFTGRIGGMSHEAALTKAFPEYHATGLIANPLFEETMGRTMHRAWESSLGLPGKWTNTADRVREIMMGMFTASENVVRLSAFEGGMAKALAEGLPATEAVHFAQQVVRTTQYLSGPAASPVSIAGLNPALRMFLQFPQRTLGYTLGTARRMGAEPGGMNLGGLGRMALTGGLTYEAGREFLGTDLSQGLIFGALPVPHPDAPFAPFPLVPPVVSLVGSIGEDILTGEWEKTPRALPLLVPGGLAMARASTVFSPETSKAIGRDYADFDNKTPDGRVPVFGPEGGLKGYYTPWQIWSTLLGVGSQLPVTQQERTLQAYLLKQRDEIRGYRRAFLDSMSRNDTTESTAINEEFRERYPFLGGIQIREQDLRAVHLRSTVSRLERTLETMPADARPEFSRLVGTLLEAEAPTLIGVDPDLLQARPTIAGRDPWRPVPPANTLDYLYRHRGEQGYRTGAAQGGSVPLGTTGQPLHTNLLQSTMPSWIPPPTAGSSAFSRF